MKRILTIATISLVTACSQNGVDASKAAYQRAADQKLTSMTNAVSRRMRVSSGYGARNFNGSTSDFFPHAGVRRSEYILAACADKLQYQTSYQHKLILAWQCATQASQQGLYLPSWMAQENSPMGQHMWAYLNAFGRNLPYSFFSQYRQQDFFVLRDILFSGGFPISVSGGY